MSMFAKKKQILAATLVVALAAAVTVNWYYSKPTKKSSAVSDASQTAETEHKNLGDSLLVAGSSVSEESTDAAGETTFAKNESDSNEEYFASVRLEQSKVNGEVEDTIKKALESSSLDDADKKELSLLLDKYNADIKTQSDCEALIKAKIGGDCVVIINGQTAQVVIEKGKSNETSALRITEIIVNNTHISPENLTIIEAK